MNLTYALFTDRGDRAVNEDSIGVCSKENEHCFVLCDGLGGHGMGDAASSLVAEVFKNQFKKSGNSSDFLASAFMAAQDILMAKQIELKARHKMKTTAVSLVTDEKTLISVMWWIPEFTYSEKTRSIKEHWITAFRKCLCFPKT